MSTTTPIAPRAHDRAVAAAFDATAARFKPEVGPDDVRLAALIAALAPLAGCRVLDLGCGKGRFATPLRRRGAEVVGIDLSAAMLGHATGIDRARASARRLPFAAGAFDAVVAVEVLEHVGAVGPVLAEARRVLRPGGRLVIIDKNVLAIDARRPWLPAAAIKWLDERRGLWMYPHRSPVRERWFVPQALRRAIEGAGFEHAAVRYLLTPRERRRWLHRTLPRTRLMTVWAATAAEGAA